MKTVQELIDELNKVEDKSKKCYLNMRGRLSEIHYIYLDVDKDIAIKGNGDHEIES